MARRKLVVGNWKMHKTTNEAIKLVTELKTKLQSVGDVEIVIAPPYTALSSVEIALQESPILLGAQNVHYEEEGAYTGEISVGMLQEIGCKYVIVGHSERRHIFQESNEILHKKLRAVAQSEVVPIFCVGETLEERKGERTLAVVEEQIKRGLGNLSAEEVHTFVMAYEPVWAIGTGETATAAQAQEMHSHIRNTISKFLDKPTANTMRILYGGSVKPSNAHELAQQPDVDGLLVGGASLKAASFVEIIQHVSEGI